MAFLIGAFVGGIMLTAIFSWVVERFAFRSLPPLERATATVGTAWLIVSMIAGFGFADGGPFAWYACLYYAPGAFIYWIIYKRGLVRAWDAEQDSLAETSE